MSSKTITFDEFKTICHAACRERNACKEGFAQMMRADTPTMLLRAWADNWNDVWKGRYADMLSGKVEILYEQYRHEFNSVGLWVNENGNRGKILVTDGGIGEQTGNDDDGGQDIVKAGGAGLVNAGGTAEVYVIGGSEVHCYDNSIVYNHSARNAFIVLHDYSHGYIDTGICVAYNSSLLNMNGGEASCFQASEVNIDGGTLRDNGHRVIRAWGDSIIYSNTNRRIELYDGAKIVRKV